jgi:hypothetical protein
VVDWTVALIGSLDAGSKERGGLPMLQDPQSVLAATHVLPLCGLILSVTDFRY